MIEEVIALGNELRAKTLFKCEHRSRVAQIHLIDRGPAYRVSSDEGGTCYRAGGGIPIQRSGGGNKLRERPARHRCGLIIDVASLAALAKNQQQYRQCNDDYDPWEEALHAGDG